LARRYVGELTTVRSRTARHEAAHATAATALGYRVSRVTIDPPATCVDFIRGADELQAALDAIAVLSSGALVDGAEHLAKALGIEDCDENRAVTIAIRTVGSQDHVVKLLEAGRTRAREVLEDAMELHAAITDALLERGLLGAEDVVSIEKELTDDKKE
jgi:hypothetical protein